MHEGSPPRPELDYTDRLLGALHPLRHQPHPQQLDYGVCHSRNKTQRDATYLSKERADFRARNKVACRAEDWVFGVHVVALRRVREAHLHVRRERYGSRRLWNVSWSTRTRRVKRTRWHYFYSVHYDFFNRSYGPSGGRVRRTSQAVSHCPWRPPECEISPDASEHSNDSVHSETKAMERHRARKKGRSRR
jgi:hypothetical protein